MLALSDAEQYEVGREFVVSKHASKGLSLCMLSQ